MAVSSDDILKRVPPQNLEAEQSVLGAILLDNDAINHSLEILSDEDFYRESHRQIFRAMAELTDHSQPVDAITLTDALRTRGVLEADWRARIHRGAGVYSADGRERRALRANRARQGGAAEPRLDRD